jgi:hypothetical protein
LCTALIGVYRAGVPLGVEAVPNIDFWRELPSLVKACALFAQSDWRLFAFSCLECCISTCILRASLSVAQRCVQDGIQFTLIKCKMLAQHANLNMQYDEVK